jgi:hypothetical protein
MSLIARHNSAIATVSQHIRGRFVAELANRVPFVIAATNAVGTPIAADAEAKVTQGKQSEPVLEEPARMLFDN